MTNNWKVVKLADVTSYVNRGIPPVYTQGNSGTAVINQKCIRGGQVNFDLGRLTDESIRQIPQDKLVQPYDILVNSTGTGTVGRVGQVIDLTQRTTVDSHVTIVRPKKEQVDPIFLGIWLKSLQDELEDLAEGSSNQVELSRDKIASVKIVLPALNIQRKIATILTSINDEIKITDQIIQKTEVLKKGLMNELLTKGIGHKKFKETKLGEIPKAWDVLELGNICDVRDGTHTSPKYVHSGIPLITSKNLIDGSLDFENVSFISESDHAEVEKRSKVDNGDILFGMIGTIGNPVIVNKQRNFSIKNVALIKFTKSNVNNIYLMYYFKSKYTLDQFRKLMGGSTQKFVALGAIRKLLIMVPSLHEQEEIAKILSTIDKKNTINKKNREKLISLKMGLMHDIFNQKVQIN